MTCHKRAFEFERKFYARNHLDKLSEREIFKYFLRTLSYEKRGDELALHNNRYVR